MRYDPKRRERRYQDLYDKLIGQGFAAEILMGKEQTDGIAVGIRSPVTPKHLFMLMTSGNQWYLIPSGRQTYRFACLEDVLMVTAALMSSLRTERPLFPIETGAATGATEIPIQALWETVETENLTRWTACGWRHMNDKEEDAAWVKFRVACPNWPKAYPLPAPSREWQLPIITEPSKFEKWEARLTRHFLGALRRCTTPGEWLYVLDWYHTCFWFNPHAPIQDAYRDSWAKPILQDEGDNYYYVAPDLRFGLLGRWHRGTICAFGERLVAELTAEPTTAIGRLVDAVEA